MDLCNRARLQPRLSGNGAPGEVDELMVDGGVDGADVSSLVRDRCSDESRSSSEDWWEPTAMHSDMIWTFSVTARQVRVKFAVTVVMYPVLRVAQLTEHGYVRLCLNSGHACLPGMNSRERCRLRGTTATIWDLLYTDGQGHRKVVTVSPVTLSETVESPKGFFLEITDVAEPVQAGGDRNQHRRSRCPRERERVALSDTHSVSGMVLSSGGITGKGKSALAKGD